VVENVAVVVDFRRPSVTEEGQYGVKVFWGQSYAIDEEQVVTASQRPLIIEPVGGLDIGVAQKGDVVGGEAFEEGIKRRHDVIDANRVVDTGVVAVNAGLRFGA